MREHKFRAYTWDCKYPDYKKEYCMMEVLQIDFESKTVVVPYKGDKERREHFSNIKLVQFTGLTDKNGKEIYEGDIMTDTEDVDLVPYSVVWCDQSGQWRTHCEESENCSVFETSEDLVEYAPSDEVIGNIHQQPELIKEI